MQSCKMKPDWDKHRVAIFHLYQNEKKPLKDVMLIMSQKHSFVASIKQYKDQLRKWKMVKNLNQKDVALCLYALDEIERENRQQVVLLRGRVMTRGDLATYLKKTRRREENLRAAIPQPPEWPSHIRFVSSQLQLQTPPSSRGQHVSGQERSPTQLPDQTTPSCTTHSPWNVVSTPSKLLTPRSSLSNRTSLSSMRVAESGVASEVEDEAVPLADRPFAQLEIDEYTDEVDFCEEDEVCESDSAKICTGLAQSDNFGAIVRQAVTPRPLSGTEQSDRLLFSLLSTSAPAIYGQDQRQVPAPDVKTSESIFATALKHDRATLVGSYPIDLTHVLGHESLASAEPSVSFLRECLGACIVQGQGFSETADVLMHGAVQDFKTIISQGDPYCLTALNLLIALLESVGQRPLAETILRKILETESELLENDNPVSVTIGFLLEIVCGRAKESLYDIKRMWQVYHGLCALWGADSPSALTGLYHVAWTLALINDIDARKDAWVILEPLNLKCEDVMGACHLQTITAMATSARVLYHLGQHWDAARMINRAIQRLHLVFEDFHPYRLEARSRQAKLLMKLNGAHDVETILQDVVRQQAAILGIQNSRTQSTLATLQQFLRSKGRSQEACSLPEILERMINN